MVIQLDSDPEVERVERLAAEMGRRARVAVRVRLDSAAYAVARARSEELPDLAHFIDTEQVGSSRSVATQILRRAMASPHLDVEGFHFHLGRLSRHPSYLHWWSAEVGELVVQISDALGYRPRILNIGGGYAREREPENVGGPLMNATTIEEYAEAVTSQLIRTMGGRLEDLPELWLEPGRYIAGNAGTLLSRVGVVKSDVEMTWVNVDASINDLPRVDNMSWDYVPLAADRMLEPSTAKVDIVGSLCVGRHLKTDGTMPPMRRGDMVAFLDAGAYAETASTQYNAVPRPATVLVRRGQSWLIKRRETVEDLFARQSVPEHLATPARPSEQSEDAT
jgi:diaminopimelate decarboxylase